MNLKERVEEIEKHFKVVIGSTTDVGTWTSKPLLCVTFDDNGFVPIDLEDEDSFDLLTTPTDQIISLIYEAQRMYLISSSTPRRKQLLEWLEECVDDEREITNGELFDYVWMKRNIKHFSRRVHEDLDRVRRYRAIALNYGEAIEEDSE